MCYTLLAVSLFFALVLSSSINISSSDIDYEVLLNINEHIQTTDQEVIFDYNEDYSQLEISSEESTAEITTQKVPTSEKKFESNIKVIKNRLKKIFNVGDINPDKKMPPDFNAPQFMTDLYHTVIEQNDTLQKITYGASTIISLPETNPSTPDLFKFDLSGISNQEILEAELHIYRIGREVSIPLHHSPYYLLRVYQVLPNGNLLSWNPDVHQLLNVHYVSSFITGWQVFKVKRALDSWLNESAPNMGFLVKATSVVNEPIDINFARRNRFNNKYQPSLVLFTKSDDSQKTGSVYPHHNSITEMQSPKSSECSKTEMYINFTTNYFKNFIIEPKGFEGHQCTGSCTHPETVQSPNYSLLKSVLYNSNIILNNICCVPGKFKSLIVLYVSGDKIVLQQIENMIVDTCSCR